MTFNNAGTLRKSAGAGTTVVQMPVNNTGTVEVQSGTLYLNGGGVSSGVFTVSSNRTLAFGGAAHTLSAAVSLSGAGSVLIAGTFTNLGTYDIGGSTTVRADAALGGTVLNVGSALVVDAGYLMIIPNLTVNGTVTLGGVSSDGNLGGSGTLTINGVLNWTRGYLPGSGVTVIGSNSVVNVSGASAKYLYQRTVNNYGTLNWSGVGGILADLGAVFNNQAGAVFDAQNDANCVGAMTFNNAGMLRKSAGLGTTLLSTPVNNTGTVEVQSGTLYLGNGGVSSGGFTVPAGKTLAFGGPHTLSAGASLSGAGSVNIASGAFTNLGTYDIGGSTTVGSGVVAAMGGTVLNVGSALVVNEGYLMITPNLTVNGTVTLGGVSSDGNLGGSGTLTINGTMNWTRGYLSGSGVTVIGSNSVVNISGASTKYLYQRTVNNHGTVNWSGVGGILADLGAVFNNQAGAVFDAQSDANCVGAMTFNNAGMLRKSAGLGTTLLSTPVNNTGTVEVQSGTLYLGNGGVSSGGFTVPAGKTLAFGGPHTLSAGASLSGAGSVNIASGAFTNLGTYDIGGSTTVGSGVVAAMGGTVLNVGSALVVNEGYLMITPNLTVNGTVTLGGVSSDGNLGGSGTLTINGTMNWTRGYLSGSGVTVIGSNSVVNVSGASTKYLYQRTVNNYGTVNWSGVGGISADLGAVFNNQTGALFDAKNDVTCGGIMTFNNAGTLRKSARDWVQPS